MEWQQCCQGMGEGGGGAGLRVGLGAMTDRAQVPKSKQTKKPNSSKGRRTEIFGVLDASMLIRLLNQIRFGLGNVGVGVWGGGGERGLAEDIYELAMEHLFNILHQSPV
jgi:hypothetical protein